MAEFKGIRPATKTTLVSSFIIIISTYLETIGVLEREIANSILPICSVGICTWLLLQPKPGTISDIAASIFGLFYLGFLPSYWIKLRGLDSVIISSNQGFISFENLSNTTGLNLTLTSCFLIVASDIGSYFIGKSLGKTSLSPISPSKTMEGLIGGISCSILLAIFFAFLMNWENPLIFGIIYGISQYGLAKQINVSNYEAEEFLNAYFAKFPEIKVYMDSTIKFCRKSGYVNNIFGRRSHFNGINDKNFNIRNFQEIAAINAPIQGSASEVMRLAMIRLDKKLNEEKNLKSKILLQIHDELIFEVPKKEEKAMVKLIQNEMTSVTQSDYHSFSTPLTVDVNVGDNWGMLH